MATQHEILLVNIERKAKALKLNDHQLSMNATGKADTIRNIRRGAMPSAARLAAIATALDTTSDQLLAPVPGETVDISPEPRARARGDQPMSLTGIANLPRDVPVYGTAEGGVFEMRDALAGPEPVELATIHDGEIIDYLRRPPYLAGRRNVYALYHVGTSMYPRFNPGDPLYVDPDIAARVGDDVVIQIAGSDGRVIGGLVKTLVRRGPGIVEVEQFNPSLRFEIDVSRIQAMHRIIPVRELLSI